MTFDSNPSVLPPRNKKIAFFAILGVILTAVAVAGGLYYFALQTSNSEWVTYRSSDGVFSFKIPRNWFWSYTDDDSLGGKRENYQVVFNDKEDNDEAGIILTAAWSKRGLVFSSFEEFEAFLKEEAQAQGSNTTLEKQFLAGLPAYKADFRNKQGVLQSTSFMTFYKDRVFVIGYSINREADTEENKKILSEIVNSFKILK